MTESTYVTLKKKLQRFKDVSCVFNNIQCSLNTENYKKKPFTVSNNLRVGDMFFLLLNDNLKKLFIGFGLLLLISVLSCYSFISTVYCLVYVDFCSITGVSFTAFTLLQYLLLLLLICLMCVFEPDIF